MRYILRDRFEHNERRFHRFEIYDIAEGRYLEKNEYPFDIDFNDISYPGVTISEIKEILMNFCTKLNFDGRFREYIK